jgi:vacuolar-type H+-ATPase subunit D/Vma8
VGAARQRWCAAPRLHLRITKGILKKLASVDTMYLREKRDDYLLKLEKLTTPLFFQRFLDTYKETVKTNKIHKNLLKEFQSGLKSVSAWSEEDQSSEYSHMQTDSGVSYLSKLISNVFKIYVLIWNSKKAQTFAYPTAEQFIYQCYLSIARSVWKEPYLFYDKVAKQEYQKNLVKLEKAIPRQLNRLFKCTRLQLGS